MRSAFALTASVLVPLVASAQAFAGGFNSSGDWYLSLCLGDCTIGAGIGGLFGTVLGIINGILVPTLFAVAFIVFLWGIFQFYIFEGQDVEGQRKGHMLMLWGLIGFAVMFSVWGIINIIVATFGLNSPYHPPFPVL